MEQHTPSPSGIKVYPHSYGAYYIPALAKRHRAFLVENDGDRSILDEIQANAVLFEAAPDLLEALEALMGTCFHRVEWERKWPNIVKKCRDVTAKARP